MAIPPKTHLLIYNQLSTYTRHFPTAQTPLSQVPRMNWYDTLRRLYLFDLLTNPLTPLPLHILPDPYTIQPFQPVPPLRIPVLPEQGPNDPLPPGNYPNNTKAATADPSRDSAPSRKKQLDQHSQSGGEERRKNIRNIIPNLARKILSYICSEESRVSLMKYFPHLTAQEVEGYYQFANLQKNSLSFYIGNKDLIRLWSSSSQNPKYLLIARVLSKNFLNGDCISSILLSRRMKPSLKIQHLRYRRKILKILQKGKKTK